MKKRIPLVLGGLYLAGAIAIVVAVLIVRFRVDRLVQYVL